MDAASISTRNVEFELTHPGTGKGLGIHIELRPNDSDEVSEAQDSANADIQAVARRGQTLSRAETAKVAKSVTLAAIANIRFDPPKVEGDDGPNWNGKTAYSAELAAEMVSADWVRSQISDQRNIQADFFRPSDRS